MKEYQFDYTNRRASAVSILSAMATFLVILFFCVWSKLREILSGIISSGFAILVFHLLKPSSTRFGTATIAEDHISIACQDCTMYARYDDLVSYTAYYGANGTTLTLKTVIEDFELTANKHYSNTEAFTMFCQDLISQLDKYKNLQYSGKLDQGF